MMPTSPLPENIAAGSFVSRLSKDELTLETADNDSPQPLAITSRVQQRVVHFYFCLEGEAVFHFGPHYSRPIIAPRNYFFYNPDKDLPFVLRLAPHCRMVSLAVSLGGLHSLLALDALPFLKPENVQTKFYDEREIPAALLVVLHQLFAVRLSESSERLFFHGKALEILSLYFSDKKPDTESCPFLNNQDTVRKLKHAKDLLLRSMEHPPGLKELARLAGLNEYQLKVGFKEIYGNTVYGFLLDHKLDHARAQLDTGRFRVSEVAYQIGYANPSHFIAAFRRKFGVTPKKYLMNKSR